MDLFRKRAKNYNFAVQLYHLLGFRIGAYRKQAIEALHLKAGDTVADTAVASHDGNGSPPCVGVDRHALETYAAGGAVRRLSVCRRRRTARKPLIV